MTLEYAASPELIDVGILNGVSVNIALQCVLRVGVVALLCFLLRGEPLPAASFVLSSLCFLFFAPAPWEAGDPLGGAGK